MKIRRMNNEVLEICDENNEVILSIEEKAIDNGIEIYLKGELKNEVAHELEDEVMAALSVCKRIVINFENVTYIASMSLKSLLSIQQIIDEIQESSMLLTHVKPEVMAIFEESGFSEILEIETE